MSVKILIAVFFLFTSLVAYAFLHMYNSNNSMKPDEGNGNEVTDTETDEGEDENGGTEAHSHTYGEWKMLTDPSCTTDGQQTRSCECGHSETETILAFGHMYMGGECLFCGEKE